MGRKASTGRSAATRSTGSGSRASPRRATRRAPLRTRRMRFFCARAQRTLTFPVFADDAKFVFRRHTRDASRPLDADFDTQSSDELIRDTVQEKTLLLLRQFTA